MLKNFLNFFSIKKKNEKNFEQVNEEHNDSDYIICSECFKDEGLKVYSEKIGENSNSACSKCKSIKGRKLNIENVQNLAYSFFVRGSTLVLEYGAAPLIQFNDYHYQKTDIEVSSWLYNDIKIIEEAAKIGFFYYGPRLWMLGEIEPLKSLQDKNERMSIIKDIIKKYPTLKLTPKNHFYRIRIKPQFPSEIEQYDSPPDEFLGKGRLDSVKMPILYASPDIDICIHECRATIDDKIFMAKLVPTKTLKLLNLTALIIEKGVTEFESLDLAVHFLFSAAEHSYEICKDIAIEVSKRGYDGIVYPSYFSKARTGTLPAATSYGISIRMLDSLRPYAEAQSVPNIALFGRPIKDGKVKVDCINRLFLNKVDYDYSFGPAYHGALFDEED
jgi:hypothetical protein